MSKLKERKKKEKKRKEEDKISIRARGHKPLRFRKIEDNVKRVKKNN